MADLWAPKPLDILMAEVQEEGGHSLKRTLGPGSLITLGMGAMIGSGIFVLMGMATARYAGPAVILSFLFAALGCVFAGLCYAEFASLIPVAGSAYTYGYATLGELFAWIIGWDLVLEYGFGAATVASGWSGYVLSFLGNFGIKLPPAVAGTWSDEFIFYRGHWEHLQHILPQLEAVGIDPTTLPHAHGVFNLLAFLVIVAVTAVLVIGIKESANFNNAMVLLKIGVLVVFVIIGGYYLLNHPALRLTNWREFLPRNTGEFGRFGWSGVCRGAAFIFFAYIGFDAVSTAAQEARNPQRDLPTGILGSLGVCTGLYMVVAGVLISLVNYKSLDVADPLAVGVEATGLHWARLLVTLGAVGGLTSTILVLLLGQSRILYFMSKDGLLPALFSAVHPRFRTPYQGSILVGMFAAGLSGFVPIDALAEMVSIGTLLAFASVCVGVWFLRHKDPQMYRPFRAPWVPFVPIMGIVAALIMMLSLTRLTWIRLSVWFVIGIAIYFGYGRNHSRVQQLSRPVLSPDGIAAGSGGSQNSPEQEFLANLLRGLFRVLVLILAAAAVLSVLSTFFPIIEKRFDTFAAALSIAAIFAGFAYAIAPEVKSLWLLRQEESELQDGALDVDEVSPRQELIDRLRKESDGEANAK